MDYLKALYALVYRCQTSSARERLISRNPHDPRLKYDMLYTERHHIVPRSMGGDDKHANIIVVLPEEHIFIHQLGYKIFDSRVDMLAVRFCLNGFNNKKKFKVEKFKPLTKKIRQGYAWIRQESVNFRKIHGWQTADGKTRISKAMKNKIIVKDSLTGELMGKHPNTHPKILSGEWVHHTKGLCQVINPDTDKRMLVQPEEAHNYKKWSLPSKGSMNTNYSGITKDQILNAFEDYLKELLISKDPSILSGPDFNKWLKNNRNGFPGFPMVLKPFRFPEIENSEYKSMEFMIRTFAKEQQETLLGLLKTKSKSHREKIRNKLRRTT